MAQRALVRDQRSEIRASEWNNFSIRLTDQEKYHAMRAVRDYKLLRVVPLYPKSFAVFCSLDYILLQIF